MATMTEADKANFKARSLALVESVAEASEEGVMGGAPEGMLYMALATDGCTLDEFNAIVGFLTKGGFVTRDAGHLLRITKRGAEAATTIKAMRASRG